LKKHLPVNFPARELCSADREQGERIAALRSRYQVLGHPQPKGGALCDLP
jgi:hypothetical protein